MAQLIRHESMPDRYGIVTISDVHLGARTCHEEELEAAVDLIRRRRNLYWLFGGDMIEGKPTRTKHFDPNCLVPTLTTIEQQAIRAADLFRPIASKCLAFGQGNHDRGLMPDFDIAAYMAEKAGVPQVKGAYQTWVCLGPDNALRIHMFHGRRIMPRGAKDPVQKKGNQNAWLANELFPLSGDAHICLMGHVHQLHVLPPIPEYGLYVEGDEVRARNVTPMPSKWLDRKTGLEVEIVPKHARWYACMGTFRRSGGFGFVDYAEIGGFPPSPVGYQIIWVKDHQVEKIETVIP